MHGKSQKILARILAVFTVFLVIFDSSIVYSQADTVTSGLRSCAADPVCKLSIASNLKELTFAPKVVPIAQNIGLKVLDGGASQVAANSVSIAPAATVASGGTIARTIISGIPIVGGAIAAFFFGVSQIENMQQKAADLYCTSGANPAICGAGFRLTFYSSNNGGNVSFNIFPNGYVNPSYQGFLNAISYVVKPSGISNPPHLIEYTRQNGTVADQGGDAATIVETPFKRLPWEEWLPSEREAAVNLLTPEDLQRAIEAAQSSPLIDSIPQGAANLQISGIPNGFRLVPDGNGGYKLEPIGDPLTLPVSQPDPDGDLDGDGIPNKNDPDIDGDGIPNASDSEPYKFNGSNPNPSPTPTPTPTPNPTPTPTPNPTPTPTPTPNPSPSAPPEPTGEVPANPAPAVFSKPNFITYALTVFKTKFPLDIVGELPPSQGAEDCPKVTFWNEDFEVCIVRDFLKMLKIPVIISFIIWAIVTL